jgi:hypothetical protein
MNNPMRMRNEYWLIECECGMNIDWAIRNDAERYGTLRNNTERYWAIRNNTERYGTMRNDTERYWAIRNNTERYGMMRSYTELYGIILSCTEQYGGTSKRVCRIIPRRSAYSDTHNTSILDTPHIGYHFNYYLQIRPRAVIRCLLPERDGHSKLSTGKEKGGRRCVCV